MNKLVLLILSNTITIQLFDLNKAIVIVVKAVCNGYVGQSLSGSWKCVKLPGNLRNQTRQVLF